MNIEFCTDDTQYIEEVISFINEWNNDLDFIEIKTSGSTGNPKTIKLRKKHMIASAKMTGDFLKLEKGNTALLCLSPTTVAGKMMIVRSIVLGMKLIVVDVNSNPLKNTNESIDFAAMVPLQVQNSLNKLTKVKKLIVGGGTISNQLWKSISEQNISAYQTFGMTETISHIAMREISSHLTNYVPLNGVVIKKIDDCLNISASKLGIENLQTTDIVELKDDGSFLWLGRKDFVINSGGIKLHPEIIENKLDRLISQPFFVFGLDDEQFGKKLILCVEGSLNVTKKQFLSFLERYEIPKEIYNFPSFDRTKSDKINRIKTVERLADAERKVL